MDRVRFGRALGFGAREAAKALAKAADAALADNPRAAATPQQRVVAGAAPVVRTAGAKARVVQREGKRFGEAVWGPVARASGVVWLEVTGVFFGLFAVTAGVQAWKHRMDFAGDAAARQHEWFAVGMLALFGWFTASSFLRARARGRR